MELIIDYGFVIVFFIIILIKFLVYLKRLFVSKHLYDKHNFFDIDYSMLISEFRIEYLFVLSGKYKKPISFPKYGIMRGAKICIYLQLGAQGGMYRPFAGSTVILIRLGFSLKRFLLVTASSSLLIEAANKNYRFKKYPLTVQDRSAFLGDLDLNSDMESLFGNEVLSYPPLMESNENCLCLFWNARVISTLEEVEEIIEFCIGICNKSKC